MSVAFSLGWLSSTVYKSLARGMAVHNVERQSFMLITPSRARYISLQRIPVISLQRINYLKIRMPIRHRSKCQQ